MSGRPLDNEGRSFKRARLDDQPTQFTPNAYNDHHSRGDDQQSVETTSRPASALAQALAAKAFRVAKMKAEKALRVAEKEAALEATSTKALRVAKMKGEKAAALEATSTTTTRDPEFSELAKLLDLHLYKTDTNELVRSSISCIKALRGQRDYQLEHQQHAKQLTSRTIQELQSEAQNYRAQCLQLQKANDKLRAANGLPPLNDRFDDDDDGSDIDQ